MMEENPNPEETTKVETPEDSQTDAVVENSATQAEPAQATTKPQENSKGFLVTMLVIIILFLLGVVGYMMMSDTEEADDNVTPTIVVTSTPEATSEPTVEVTDVVEATNEPTGQPTPTVGVVRESVEFEEITSGGLPQKTGKFRLSYDNNGDVSYSKGQYNSHDLRVGGTMLSIRYGVDSGPYFADELPDNGIVSTEYLGKVEYWQIDSSAYQTTDSVYNYGGNFQTNCEEYGSSAKACGSPLIRVNPDTDDEFWLSATCRFADEGGLEICNQILETLKFEKID